MRSARSRAMFERLKVCADRINDQLGPHKASGGGYEYRPNTPSTPVQHLDNGINARRERIGVLGTFMGDWKYALVFDFGGSSDGFGGTAAGSLPGGRRSPLQLAYLSYVGIPGLAIEGGYLHVPYTLDEAT